MKIIFFGTSEFSTEILQSLFDNKDFSIGLVVTTPDKPVGRKQILASSEVSVLADKLNLKVIKPQKLSEAEVLNEIDSIAADMFVVAAYGKILPQSILDIPKLGCINIHASLLPKYRGASPIHQSIINGDKQTGITFMLMDSLLDHGKILSQLKIDIDKDETEEELSNRLAGLSAENIATCLTDFAAGKIAPVEQNHSMATFTNIIKKEDGKIDWSSSSLDIYNKYRAYNSWPGIYTFYKGLRLKISKCALGETHIDKKVGEVFEQDGKIFVSCGKGSLRLSGVQLEGKNKIAIKEFINGQKEFIGSIL
jgi:methionyl-tRNA formyltransferase